MNSANSVGSYYDFGGLSRLRAEASTPAATSQETIHKVAAEFESAFYQMLLESMKKASEPLKSDLLESDTMDQFQDMFYTEVAHFMANRQALGIAPWVEQVVAAQRTTETAATAQ
jgi:Rod binding domain-containing protein